MNNHKIILPSIAAAVVMTMFVVWSLLLLLLPSLVATSSTIIQKAKAENATTNATIPTNANITLGNPIFTENDKTISRQGIVINGSQGFKASFAGSGMIKGVNFTDIGNALIVLRPDGYSNIQGKAVIITNDGSEKGSYTLYSIGHADVNGTIRDNGAAFFHTNSTGKLAIANNLVVIFRDQVDKAGNGMTVGWELK
jgi:hypothetical protein